ncbi:ribosomal protein L1-like protein [Lipomyces arxii]|uniref:mitochondrial 54S ribosomal protein uL1m n=1 Tax=Lipomyces arxii TaxID=56418 RepID=UPI0034CF5DF6
MPRLSLAALDLVSSTHRPLLPVLRAAEPRFKGDKRKGGSSISKPTAVVAAQARAKVQEKDARRKAFVRSLEKERMLARTTKNTPVLMDVQTASKYLKAAEVGHADETNTVTMTLKLALPLHFQPLRGSVRLPKQPVTERIAVFTESPEIAEAALQAGATYAGGEELVAQVQKGEVTFEKAFATPGAGPLLRPVQRLLGPRGLMPNERRGTMAENVITLLEETQGALNFQTRGKQLTAVIGKASFTDSELEANVGAFMSAYREAVKKSNYKQPPLISEIVLSSTFGPGVMIVA